MAVIGKVLDGRYRIVEILGSGAFGQTYLAEDIRRPGEPQCVVKQLCPTSNGSVSLQAASRLFKREAETLEKLGRHDKIPQLLAYFAENNKFYLVKEYTAGHPLTQEIIPGQPLPESEVVSLLAEVLDILVFVHANRVIHRDIKPANLIRRAADNKLVLIDFGSVKEITSQISNSSGPWTIAAGTPAYMPVEQFQGNPQYSSDLYSLGMVAIQALTGLPAGELPKLQDPHSGKILWRQRAVVSPQLADILDKMLHHNYGARYPSAARVLEDLSQLPNSTLVSPSAMLTQYELPRLAKQRRSYIWGGIGVVLVGMALMWLWGRPDKTKSQDFYKRGVDRSQEGDHRGAIANYTQALRFNAKDAELYYKRANAHYDLGEYAQAIVDYTQAIKLNPNYADAYYNRADAKSQSGDGVGVIEDLNQVIKLNPNDPQAHYKRATAYFELQDYPTAIRDYTEAVRLAPNDAKAYLGRGLARSAAGDKQGAIADYTQSIQRSPQEAEAYYSRARARYFLADYQGAKSDYSKAIELNPKHYQAYSSRCGAHLNLGDRRAAVADCTRAIELNRDDGVGYENRCVAYLNLGEHRKAIEDCTQAIRLNANNAKAYSNRGLARSLFQDRLGAIEDYTQAIRINPSDAVAYGNRAAVHYERQDYTSAIADYSQGIRLNPAFAMAYAGRGVARANLGDKAGALEDLQKAASLYLEQGRPDAYKDVQQQISKLKS
ncbi:MAG TPA: tetratricopeptide repeat protein [Halomicronema sp.]